MVFSLNFAEDPLLPNSADLNMVDIFGVEEVHTACFPTSRSESGRQNYIGVDLHNRLSCMVFL